MKKSCGILIKQIHDETEKRINISLPSFDPTMAQMSALPVIRKGTAVG